MDSKNRKFHWEKVFQNNDTSKVSWYQAVPETSLRLIVQLPVPKSAKFIDVGAGDSYMADHLLLHGFTNISLLDISGKALSALKIRLGENASQVNFIEKDVLSFMSSDKFDIWHDRAVFHFFTNEDDIQSYVRIVSNILKENGYLIIGTFSENGPDSCSGLRVQKYSEDDLVMTFSKSFKKISCFTENHLTPSKSVQNFRFCVFQKKEM